jgi:hypothetical protein
MKFLNWSPKIHRFSMFSEGPERFPDVGRDKHFHTAGGRRLETSKGRNRGKSVAGLPSMSPLRIAVIGRQKL